VKLSEELSKAISRLIPVEGFMIRVLDLKNARYPGSEAQGILPIVVTGHVNMSEGDWTDWVRGVSIPVYGSGYTERMLSVGIDIREMTAARAMGRAMRETMVGQRVEFDRMTEGLRALISAVEKWPSLAHAVALGMIEEDMTLGEWVRRVSELPLPSELGMGPGTLGDMIAKTATLTPNF